MNQKRARRFLIEGRVQGVWFRAGTREQALALGLSGEARNLPDGRVEVFAEGPQDALDALQRWLQTGPPLARVSEVSTCDIPCDGRTGFSVG